MGDRHSQGQISLQYDEFSDLLGGVEWGWAFDQWCRSTLSSGRRQNLRLFDSYFSSPHQFLFSEDRHRFPLELFWLKWNLITTLCRRIQSIHQEHQRPLLNLQPALLQVNMAETSENFLPARWAFSLDTTNLQLAERFTPPNMPSSFPAQLFTPPPDVHPLYSRALTIRGGIEQKEGVTLLIRSMERMRESGPGEVRGIVQAQLVSENLRSSDYSPADIFFVNLYLPDAEDGPIRIWAGKRASTERGMLLEGATEPIPPSHWERFQKARQKVCRSEVVIYKSLHLSCDLYSLGMILFRTLLVNDQHDIEGVHQAINKIAEQIGPVLPSFEEKEDKLLSRKLRFYLRKEGEIFSKEALLYQVQEREKGCGSIPNDLWTEALLIGFRLIQNQGEWSADQIKEWTERLITKAERLGDHIKMELFGSSQRNREILEACDLLRNELHDAREK